MKSDSISTRGAAAGQSVPRIDLEVYFEALHNLYDPISNPDGALPLNMAENKLCWAKLAHKIREISSVKVPDWVAGYTSPIGHPSVRQAMGAFISKHIAHCAIDADCLALSSGATGVIESTAFILGEPGDVAVLPAPSYPVYTQDISTLGQLKRFDLHTHHELTDLQHGPLLTPAHLSDCLARLRARQEAFRLLVITSPDNPTGLVYAKRHLADISDWCEEHKVHLIVNEIYKLSLIDTNHPSIRSDYAEAFSDHSFLSMIEERKSPYLHWWYSLSKDFGVSGLRMGCLYSRNEHLLKAFQNVNLGRMPSNHTQWLVEQLVKDEDFVHEFIKTNQTRLTQNYVCAVETMRQLNVPYVPARGSLFLWIDLSEFLSEPTQSAENIFWMHLFDHTGILLTPGQGFGHTKKGQFRIVHSFLPYADFKEAMGKFTQYISERR